MPTVSKSRILDLLETSGPLKGLNRGGSNFPLIFFRILQNVSRTVARLWALDYLKTSAEQNTSPR